MFIAVVAVVDPFNKGLKLLYILVIINAHTLLPRIQLDVGNFSGSEGFILAAT
jgi:hypothetical protein